MWLIKNPGNPGVDQGYMNFNPNIFEIDIYTMCLKTEPSEYYWVLNTKKKL